MSELQVRNVLELGMDEYKSWEQNSKEIKKENKILLSEFSIWLSQFGFVKKTVKNHCSNVKFYINNFLLYDDAVPAKDGADMIGYFLGYWFVKKTMWASVDSIKKNIASLKKFYKFMAERGDITTKQFNEFTALIKEEQSEWLATIKRYQDPDIDDMEEVWGL